MKEPDKFYEWLCRRSSEELLTILHDCVELLQPVRPLYMSSLKGGCKKTILNQMESGKYMIFEFDDRKFPIVNDHFKSKPNPNKN